MGNKGDLEFGEGVDDGLDVVLQDGMVEDVEVAPDEEICLQLLGEAVDGLLELVQGVGLHCGSYGQQTVQLIIIRIHPYLFTGNSEVTVMETTGIETFESVTQEPPATTEIWVDYAGE